MDGLLPEEDCHCQIGDSPQAAASGHVGVVFAFVVLLFVANVVIVANSQQSA